MLRRVSADDILQARRTAVDAATLAAAAAIVADVRLRGEAALREHAERLGDIAPGAPLLHSAHDLQQALASLPETQQALLQRTAERVRAFADAQRRCLTDLTVTVPGGRAGHRVTPLQSAGCYAPGGRFPLPSSVLMTAVTARTAGVSAVWVASPRPTAVTLAAAAVAGADGLLAVGGAQAVAALAHGAGSIPACDAVVGPGNRWVTAAKQCIAGEVAIDMLAGPSELVVLADSQTADARVVAADLLAQAEHDADALPILVTPDESLAQRVDDELARQLATLPTAETARQAVANGYAVITTDLDTAIAVCDRLAPEHLEVMVANAPAVARRLRWYGGLFIGAGAAEVYGDYGAGPNHVLPTGGTARVSGGLSVLTFLRVRTWLELDDPSALAGDAAALARIEGLEGHARSAEAR